MKSKLILILSILITSCGNATHKLQTCVIVSINGKQTVYEVISTTDGIQGYRFTSKTNLGNIGDTLKVTPFNMANVW